MSKVVVIGDVMLDHYIYGTATRISPEAPIPVVKRNTESSFLGGAANVALNLRRLNVDTFLIGAVGNDSTSLRLEDILEKEDIKFRLIPFDIPTTRKTRIIANRYQVVRVDQEEQTNVLPKDIDLVIETIQKVDPEYVLISDYAKGFCSEELCKACIKYCHQNNIKVLVDPKKPDWTKFTGAYLIKPNKTEWEAWLQTQSSPNGDSNELTASFLLSNKIEHLIVTLGSKGMVHIDKKGAIENYLPQKVDVFDVSGAGDTVLAVLTYAFLHKKNIQEAIQLSNKAASFVITKPHTYPISESELNKLI